MSLLPSDLVAKENPWAAELAAFAEEDRTQPYPPRGVVFVGSSSIRLWDLAAAFPQLEPAPLNRGFGGSQLSDVAEHWPELVAKHQPGVVVLYAGDNDLAAGKSAERVLRDFERVLKQWSAAPVGSKLYYLSIKPSPSRWHLAPEARRANELLRVKCAATRQVVFVDLWNALLDRHGQPQRKLFVEDRLHLSPAGYAIWNDRVGPLLLKIR